MFEFLGIGRGKLNIVLNNYNYSPGDTISGQISLELKKQIQSKGIFISLYGEQSQESYDAIKKRTETRTERIFEFRQPIDGERSLTPGQPINYPFMIKIPSNVISKLPDGVLGNLVKAAQFLSHDRSNTKWYLLAHVVTPKSIDMRKTVQINIA
jgi:hypothetical protein